MGDFLLYRPVYRQDSGIYIPLDVRRALDAMQGLSMLASVSTQPYLQNYVTTMSCIFDPIRFYLIVGDEPTDLSDQPISNFIDAATLANITESLKSVPRQKILSWLSTNIGPSIDPSIWPKINRGLFDLYNSVNLQALADQNVNVWVWEYMKIQSWLQAYPNDTMPDDYKLTLPFIKARMRDYIASTYEDLDTIADFGYELSRALAVDKLLKMEEYFSAIALINTYANLEPDQAALLTKEFEKDNLIVDYATSAPISPSDHPLASL